MTLHRSAVTTAAMALSCLLAGTVGCFKDNGPCPVMTLTVTPNPMVIVRNTSRQFPETDREYSPVR